MEKPSTETKAMLVAQIAAGIYADHQTWIAFEHEANKGESWDAFVLKKAKRVAFQIWKDAAG